jgi:MinD superfamily P-loop ATPase
VIASLSGVSLALVVTEPTVSGLHDLQRVLALARHFSVPTAVCVNKWDINPQQTEKIEAAARSAGAAITGRIRYDRSVTQAQLQQKAVVELDAGAGDDIRVIWKQVTALL